MATVQDILTKKGTSVVSLVSAESVLTASRIMNERCIGGVVITENDRLAGIFTERDILRRVVSEQRDPASTSLRDVMTAPAVCCQPDATLEELTVMMTEKRIRHVPVVDDSGLCGIITTGDILAYQVREQAYTIQHLNNYVHDMR